MVRIEAYGSTDVGLLRTHNEDYFDINEEARVYVVADGMGGHNHGEVASQIAVRSMAGVLRSALAGLIAATIALLARLPRPRTAGQLRLLLFSGLASFAAWPMLMSLGLGSTTANHAGLMQVRQERAQHFYRRGVDIFVNVARESFHGQTIHPPQGGKEMFVEHLLDRILKARKSA